MKARRLVRLSALLLALCVFLSGCSIIGLDVENQLIPPQNDKEQNAMQTALHAYLQTDDIILTYPNSGDYKTPFIVLNQIKEREVLSSNREEEPVVPNSTTLGNWGVVFYRRNADNAKTHVHLLNKNDSGVWGTVADIEGFSEEVAEVNFADLNGDDFPELLVGWNLYNSHDKRLAIYHMDKQLAAVDFENAYTALLTADMTDDKAEDLLLFTVGSGGVQVKAKLFSYVDSHMQFRGETLLDSGIKTIGNALVAALSPSVNGIFVDCEKDADTTITELIYWNNSTLESPFCNKETGLNTMTARENGLSCRDIDGDGMVEWPVSKRLSGYEKKELSKALWKTDWMSYDFRGDKAIRKFSSIVNLMDGYMLRLREEWTTDNVRISYYEEDCRLTLQATTADTEFLELLSTPSNDKKALPDGFSYFDGLETRHFAVKMDEEVITPEEVQYLFVVL